MDKYQKKAAQVKNIKAALLILMVFILVGCSSPANQSPTSTGAIWATDILTSFGSSSTDASKQVISYQITLKNREPASITIHSLTLLFPSELDKRMLSDRKVTVENTIEPNTDIKITGQLTFDASGTTKTQISGWGPPIKGIFATMDQSVFFQSQGQTK